MVLRKRFESDSKRRAIRAALAEDGIMAEIEALVDALLPP
jgi:hypothetical protein